MKASGMTAALAMALSAAALAQTPPEPPPGPDEGAPGLEGHDPRGERRRFAPSDREQEEMAAFMKQFAPNRWAAMEAMPDDGAFRRGAMAFAAARWRHLQYLREEDPALYDIKVRQLMAEDSIFGLLAATRTPADRVPLRKQLREHVTELVKQGLIEREHRINRLRQEIKEEEDRLAGDRKNIEALIDRRTDAYVTEGPSPRRPEAPRRPFRDGPGTRPTSRPAEDHPR